VINKWLSDCVIISKNVKVIEYVTFFARNNLRIYFDNVYVINVTLLISFRNFLNKVKVLLNKSKYEFFKWFLVRQLSEHIKRSNYVVFVICAWLDTTPNSERREKNSQDSKESFLSEEGKFFIITKFIKSAVN